MKFLIVKSSPLPIFIPLGPKYSPQDTVGREKTLTKNSRDLQWKGTHKHMETYSKYFDGHRHLSQSEESKCM